MSDSNDKKLVTLQGLKKYHRDSLAAGAARIVTYTEDMFDDGIAGVRLPDNTGHLHFEEDPFRAVENIVFESGEPQDGRRLTVSFDSAGSHLGISGNITEYLYQHNAGRGVHREDGSAPGAWYDLIYYHGKWWDMGYHDSGSGSSEERNAFSVVSVPGQPAISADSATDTLTLEAGDNVTILADAESDKVTISATDTTYDAATQSEDGLMSAADKAKLDGIAAGANKYTLPVATSSVLGGVKSGGDVTVDSSGNVSVNDDSHNHVISNVDGLQSALDSKYSDTNKPTTDFLKDGTADVIDETLILTSRTDGTATNTVLYKRPATYLWNYIKSKISSVLGLTSTNYGGTAAKATADASGNTITSTYATKTELDGKAESSHTHTAASSTAAGFMSAADKAKLDGIATGANKYSLPVATSSALGGVKSGTDITVDSSGNVSVKDDSHNHVISNVDGLQSALDGKAASSHSHSAYVNQNAFSKVAVSGQTTVAADSATDTLTLAAGSNVTITTDATNDKVTIAAKDTTYNAATQSAAGLMSASDKKKLDGLTLGTLEITTANFAQYVSNYTLKLPATTTTVFLNYPHTASGTTYIEKILKSDGTVFPNGTRLTFLIGSDYHWNDWGYFYSPNDQNPYHETMTPGRITPYLYLHQRNGVTHPGYNYDPSNGDMNICDANTHIDGTTAFSYIDFLFWNGCWWDGGYETNVLPYHTHDVYANPNIFQTVRAGTTTLSPDSTEDTLNIVGSGSVTVTANASTDTITISGTNTTYNPATQSAAGLMSAADKKKLDGIATGANKYTLPVATSSALGGVKSGTDITVDSSGNVSVNNNSHTHSAANITTGTLAVARGGTGQTSAAGAANAFINALSEGSSTPVDNDYMITQYANGGTTTTTYHRRKMSIVWDYFKSKISSVLGLTSTNYGGTAAKATADGAGNTITSTYATKTAATQSAAGLMSASDKKKLDGIATGANKYSLPVATSSALGGVKSGTDITVDSSGNVSVKDDSHNHVISNVDGLQSALDGKAASSHYHGLSHTNNFALIANTTTDSGYKMLDSGWTAGFNMLKSVRTDASAPAWTHGNYSAGIAFGGADTKGIITHAYNTPFIKFAGGNGSTFVWNMSIAGASGASYSLSDFQTKLDLLLSKGGHINLASWKAGTTYIGTGNYSYADYVDASTIRIDAGNVHFPNGITTVFTETIVRVMCWGTDVSSSEFYPYGKYTASVTLSNSYGEKTVIFIPPRQAVTLQYVGGTTWTVLSKPDNGELYVNNDNWTIFASTSGRFKLRRGLPKILYLSPGTLSTTYNMSRIEIIDSDGATCYPELGETITIVPLSTSQYLTWTNFGPGAGETQAFNFNAPIAIANLKAGKAGTFKFAAKGGAGADGPYAFHWVDA